ncbi:MAG: ABC transporter related protein [Microgenomates group bacterium GW2011_GWA2_44_7]|uniref:ABC transporter related protein n=1 Tax=Candidatus Woesebacteria bacterium GW2011_GWA1_43_12 TaxID=1618557 RepID=A0A0G1CX77_9BACT|nr:MAG: ABC transporter related protein [Candidatus Woesebacteria bacterium GW2011_GWA1_43_12]KKT76250.1 MAG: ABC transporter related protein [Microgenomates group bacterium GW2011_GWA2_44_7]KKT77724.1 MAG: ABC transporter related protein [Microgenomates group bacterium GW2011_GWB1_44_8]
MWSKLWRFLSPFHGTFFVFGALMTIYGLFEVVGGYMQSLVIQLYQSNADAYVWALVILGKYVFDDIYMRLDNAVDWHIVTKHSVPLSRYVKIEMFKKMLNLDVGWHHSHQSGAVLSRVNSGVDRLEQLVNSLSWEFVPRTIQAAISLVPLIIFSPISVLVVVVASVIFIKLTLRSNEERKSIREERFKLYEKMGHREVESIQNIPTIIEYGQENRLTSEYVGDHDKQVRLTEKDFRIANYRYNRLRIWVLNVARLILVPLWVYQLQNGQLAVPTLIFIWGLTDKLFDSCWKYVSLLDRVFDAAEPVNRLLSLREEKSTIPQTGSVRKTTKSLDIVMNQVCFSYKGDYCRGNGIIHDVDLFVPEGSTIGLVGKSGAGKSTLYQLTMGMRHPHAGNLLVGGYDIRDWHHPSLLSHIAHMASGDQISIFDETVANNIAFGRPKASRGEVVSAAKQAGLHEFIMSLQENYDTKVGERGLKLSAGQKQRLAFARALLLKAPILLLDEPTSAVDSGTEVVMQEAIKRLYHKCTVMISAHRLATVMHADKIVVLEGGRKIEEGTHNELLAINGMYAHMWAIQTGQAIS